jgi:hypothetical protein
MKTKREYKKKTYETDHDTGITKMTIISNLQGIIEETYFYTYTGMRMGKHRKDGPAVSRPTFMNRKEWWVEGKLHREDGPAIEEDHRREWWVNGKRHREDGPAAEYPAEMFVPDPLAYEWWLDGKQVTWIDVLSRATKFNDPDLELRIISQAS